MRRTYFILVHFGETYRLITIIIGNTSPVLLNVPFLDWKCYVSKEYGHERPCEISVLLQILVQSRQKEPHLNCLGYVKICFITYFQNMWFKYHSRWSNNKPIDRKTFFEPYWYFFSHLTSGGNVSHSPNTPRFSLFIQKRRVFWKQNPYPLM